MSIQCLSTKHARMHKIEVWSEIQITTKLIQSQFFLLNFVIIASGVLKEILVLKVTKGLIKVSCGYSEVQFAKPLGSITLPPRTVS